MNTLEPSNEGRIFLKLSKCGETLDCILRIDSWHKHLVPIALIVSILLIAFFNLSRFGYEDDYLQLVAARWSDYSLWFNDMAPEGRALYGILILSAWSLAGSIENAIWLRIIGVFGVIVLSISTYWCAVRRFEVPRLSAICLATMPLLTPSLAIVSFWAVTAPFPWAATLSLFSGWLSLFAWEKWVPRWIPLLCSSVLLLIAETIYQPMAGFFLIPVAMEILICGSREALGRAFRALAHFGIVLVIYLVCYKLTVILYFSESARVARGDGFGDFLGNLEFFILRVLPFIASWWFALISNAWIMGAKISVLIGVLCWTVVQFRRNGFLMTVVACVLLFSAVIASAAPVIASGTYAPYRTLAVTSALLILVAGIGLYKLAPFWISLKSFFSLCMVISASLLARHVTTVMVIEPQKEEYLALQQWLELADLREIPVIITAIPPSVPSHGYITIHEFGRYSSNTPWALADMLRAMIPDAINLNPTPLIVQYYPEVMSVNTLEQDAQWYQGVLVDMRVVLSQMEKSTARHEKEAPLEERVIHFLDFLGPVKVSPSGWALHESIGWFLPGPENWVHHEEFGWLRLLSLKDDRFLTIYSHEFGVVVSDLGLWPKVFVNEDEKAYHLEELIPWKMLHSRKTNAEATSIGTKAR